ncbi:hypothetical protein [Variovorax sp. W2I14]|uniref:hypothetical protein n=1 Tax=Variovorax sp. W2I14 TaxID=3042290 RepID=UPI003D1C435A
MAQVNPLNPKGLRPEFGRDFTEEEIFNIHTEYHHSVHATRDFSIPLLWMDFPEEITKYDETRSRKYVELSYGGGQNYRYVLGESNCEIVHKDYADEVVQGCAYGISVAWNAYTLTNQYKTAQFVERNLSLSTTPRMWIRQELDLLEEYLGTIDKPENMGDYGNEWIELIETQSNYLQVFNVLPFLQFGQLAHIGSNPLFVYPSTHRQALLNCLDMHFLKTWKESKELGAALPPGPTSSKPKVQKI